MELAVVLVPSTLSTSTICLMLSIMEAYFSVWFDVDFSQRMRSSNGGIIPEALEALDEGGLESL
jgi:hypothetical protein